MARGVLAPHPELVRVARPRDAARAAERPLTWEWAVLIGCGATAACLSAALDFGLRIPGHAVLRAVLPLGLGLALVPRRGAGSAMAVSALLTGGLLHFGPGWLGPGATTSVAVLGICLDLALHTARSGRAVWIAFVVAGVATNVIAFGVRLVGKLIDGPGRLPLSAWWPTAAISYPVCGAVAGLIAGVALFRLHGRGEHAA